MGQDAHAVRPPSEAVPGEHSEQIVLEVMVQADLTYLPIPQVAHDVQEDWPGKDWKLEPIPQAEQASDEPLLKVPGRHGVVPVRRYPIFVTALPDGIVEQ